MPKKRNPQSITVSFAPRIAAHGELVRVTIKQGDDEIQLTHAQTRTLVGQLSARCSLP